MVTFLYGTAGSGKSTEIASRVRDDLKAGKQVFVIVPEQQALLTERRIADLVQSSEDEVPTVGLEVLNFKRLCNRVFREYGGLSYNYVGKGACSIIMWQALFSVAPALVEYAAMLESCDKFIPTILDTVNELKAACVSPLMLEEAAKELETDNPRVSSKLRDVSVIYSAYEKLLHENFDDPSDDLTKAEAFLSEHNFFAGSSVYVDSFDGFTAQEYRVLFRVFEQAEKVTVSLCAKKNDKRQLFDSIRTTESKLYKLSRDAGCGEPEAVIIDTNPRFENPALAFAEKNIFSLDADVSAYDGEPNGINVVACRNRYSEAEYVARAIQKKIYEGARYRDMAVIARDMTQWEGIIDAAFENHGIPFHMSRRIDLCERPLFRLILSAFKIKADGWRKEDVISYIKTGYAGILPSECDVLEAYADKWRISGRRWYDEFEWSMNPDGYTDKWTDRGRMVVEQVNQIREKITSPLIKLFDVFENGKAEVREISSAIYSYLCELGADTRISEKEGDEGIGLWNTLCEALDELVFVAGDLTVTAVQYSELLSFVVRETDTGTLPLRADEVTVGEADRLRTGNIKHSFIIGMNDGVFPSVETDRGVFTDTDRIALEGCDIVLDSSERSFANDEMLLFYKAAFCASSSLDVTYSFSDFSSQNVKASPFCESMRSLFTDIKTVYADEMSPIEAVFDKYAAFDCAFTDKSGEVSRALERVYGDDPKYIGFVQSSEIPIDAENEKLGKETAAMIFGGDLRLSASKLDAYVLCAFGFNCKYVLKLAENKPADFGRIDTGTIIHGVLEHFLTRAAKENRFDYTDTEFEIMAEQEVRVIIESILQGSGTASDCSTRTAHYFSRLKKTVLMLMRDIASEFLQSEFRPKLFELPIGLPARDDSDMTVPAMKIPLSDGSEAYICGVADRVDVFEKDGEVYFRIVDYKTGTKNFSLNDIYNGLNLQMLLYLFSLWNDNSGSFKKLIGSDPKAKVTPAGILYYSAKIPEITVDRSLDSNGVIDKVSQCLKRSGMLISDGEILRAMEKNLKGRYIPVKVKKDGGFSTVVPLETVEQFGKLMEDVSEKIGSICNELKNGVASAVPMKNKRHDGCRYCAMQAVCRRNKQNFEETEESDNG